MLLLFYFIYIGLNKIYFKINFTLFLFNVTSRKFKVIYVAIFIFLLDGSVLESFIKTAPRGG